MHTIPSHSSKKNYTSDWTTKVISKKAFKLSEDLFSNGIGSGAAGDEF